MNVTISELTEIRKQEQAKQTRANGDFVACGACFIDSLEAKSIQ